MFTTLKTLCKTPSVSGREENIRKVLSELISPYSDEVRTDALGNLFCSMEHAEKFYGLRSVNN